MGMEMIKKNINPLRRAQTALFKESVRTAL